MPLILKIILAALLGALIGTVVPEWAIRSFTTISMLFETFIKFLIPLIIFFFIAEGLAQLQKKSNKIVSLIIILAFVSTVLAGLMAIVVGLEIIPLFTFSTVEISQNLQFPAYFKLPLVPVMDILSALLLAFIIGIGVQYTHGQAIQLLILEGQNILQLLLKNIVIPILPLYILSIFVNFSASGIIVNTFTSYIGVLSLAIVLQITWLIILYTAAGIISKQNPFTLLRNMLPAYMTAFGTMSSVATIPVSIRSNKKNKVHESVVNVTVPLCATIHLCGSIITILTCSLAVLHLVPGLVQPDLTQLLLTLLLLSFVMIAAPGVPGGGVMASLGVLTLMFGFNEDAIGLMIALYMTQDSFGTAANVTGDGAISVIVDKLGGQKT
ncbi:MAG: cation:dicarboxylase symporter family transporter [Legionellales bacterium]|jgi:Na+/H+-dicarboxylate symporter